MQFEKEWQFKDGDVILTKDSFVFYTFGYNHPNDRVTAFLKYIPLKYKRLFDAKINFLEWQWKIKNEKLVRPTELYYGDTLISILQENFPEYLYFSKVFNKEIIAVPKTEIKTIFVPKMGLSQLVKKETPDMLEKEAISLIKLLSKTSEVSLNQFGIHGSILLGTHNEKSDIDIAVYGSSKFKKVKDAMRTLVSLNSSIEYLLENKFDVLRRNRGLYNSRRFVINATRQKEEIHEVYGDKIYTPLTEISFQAKITDNMEAVFRPAHYKITDFISVSSSSPQIIPNEIVSMIGQYRDIADVGDQIQGKGILEEIRDIKTNEKTYRIVIGSGRPNEYIEPY
ncbi:MAG: nucleotidyltransferase domain-containing protein [Promethearchaeota archaeon]